MNLAPIWNYFLVLENGFGSSLDMSQMVKFVQKHFRENEKSPKTSHKEAILSLTQEGKEKLFDIERFEIV